VPIRSRLWSALPPVLLVLAAAWWVFGYMADRIGSGIPSFDIYASSYPNIVYGLRSLREGHGFLWDRFQNCGQPFPSATAVSAFYPLNLVFVVLDVDRGIMAIAFLHLVIAGLGTYLLSREIGLTRPASLCGAIGFQLGNHLPRLASWHPICILGSLVWLPWALLWCERALRTPTLRAGLWLGIVLTLSLLAAFPQSTVFIYQVLLLRILWEVIVRGPREVGSAAGVLALGLLLPPILGAVQLLPAAEFAGRSVRGHQLQLAEMQPGGLLDWSAFRKGLATHDYYFSTGYLIIAALAPIALVTRTTRRQALFYAVVVALFGVLAIDGPALRLYLELPLARTFRMPARFLWVAGFGASMLIALGAQALLDAPAGARGRLLPLVLLAAGAGTLWLLAGTWPPAREAWVLAALALLAVLGALPVGAAAIGRITVVGLVLVVAGATLLASQLPGMTYDRGAVLLAGDAPILEALRARMTLQDRFYAVATNSRLGLTAKIASVTRVPSIADYEPQASRRFAELEVQLRQDRPMQNLNDYLYPLTRTPRNRRILDLLAARYLVIDPKAEPITPDLASSLRALTTIGGVTLYENPGAFARAFYVPNATVEPDASRRLQLLARSNLDLHRTVVLETSPPVGSGGPPDATGTATIESDDAEHVHLRVHAGAPGFLVLTDQDYPGWSVTVNGAPAPVLAANHAFRAVPVPGGESTVVWTYRPLTLWLSAAVSLTALGVVIALLATV
jgi:hypothetical protein